jgi:DNA-binding transcriptional MerR regulator
VSQALPAGKVARAFDVSIRQLQHWRKTGLLAPGHRTAGGHSRYTEADIRRVRLIRCLLQGGYSAHAIAALFEVIGEELEAIVEEVRLETAEEMLTVMRHRCAHE